MTSWSPTHRIIFHPTSGPDQFWEVMVIADAFGAQKRQLAATLEDWAHQWAPAWSRSDTGEWSWKGQPTPFGMPGTVEVQGLAG